jgi:UDP-galactopyranose mutase
MIEDLIKLKLITKEDKYNFKIIREEYAYPIQVNGFLEMIKDIIEKEIRPIKNLVSIGRQGLYKYCNMNECMEMAFDVVKQIEENTEKFDYHFELKWAGAGMKEERVLKKDLKKNE